MYMYVFNLIRCPYISKSICRVKVDSEVRFSEIQMVIDQLRVAQSDAYSSTDLAVLMESYGIRA